MTSAPALPPGVTLDAVASALRDFGNETPHSQKTVEAARAARVLLETLPMPALVSLLPTLWEQEEARRRLQMRDLYAGGVVGMAFYGVLTLLIGRGVLPKIVGDLSTLLTMMVSSVVASWRAWYPFTWNGIVRLMHLRPHPAFAPLLIDAITYVGFAPTLVKRAEILEVLTRLLPLWCEQDGADLSPAQQKRLLKEVARVTRTRNAFLHLAGFPHVPITLADADFVLAAIAALRHCRARAADRRAHRILSHLPAPVTHDDPRHEVRLAAESYLVQGRQ